MNLMIVCGMFFSSSFLISVCMFIVSKALLISSATVIVRGGLAIWLNPFATVLFSVCRVGVCRDYVSQPTCVRYYVFVKSSFKHTREECESKRAYVF